MFYILWDSFYLDMTYVFLGDKILFGRRKQQQAESRTIRSLLVSTVQYLCAHTCTYAPEGNSREP